MTNKYLTASRPYHHDYLTWCVQKRQPIPPWQNSFHLCDDMYVFWGVFGTAIVVIAAEYYLIQFEEPVRSWNDMLFITLRIALAQPNSFNPQTNAPRTLFLFGIFGGFIFATVLSATIMISITSPILRHQIQSIDDISNGAFKLVGDRYAFIRLIQQNQVNLKSPN